MNTSPSPSANNAPGTTDPNFGVEGRIDLQTILKAHTEFQIIFLFKGLTTDNEGNVLFCANLLHEQRGYCYGLGRLDAKGNLDPTFGTDGVVADFFLPFSNAGGSRLTVQPDGKILMLGWTWPSPSNGWADVVVARFNSQGSLDTDFAEQGLCILQTGPDEGLTEDSTTLHVQDDGCILLTANYSRRDDSSVAVGRLFRLLPDGALDTRLNGTGRLEFKLADATAATAINACISQGSDHKIVIAGHARSGPELNTALFARFNHDGSLDPHFGNPQTPGVHYVEGITDHTTFNDLTLRTDNSLVGAGQVGQIGAGATKGLLRAITPNGAAHLLFNHGQPLVSQFDSDVDNGWQCITSTRAGNLVTSSMGDLVYIARFKADGALDTAFNNEGYNQLESGVASYPVLLTERGDQRLILTVNTLSTTPDGLGVAHCFFG